jgi:hypothetical protein
MGSSLSGDKVTEDQEGFGNDVSSETGQMGAFVGIALHTGEIVIFRAVAAVSACALISRVLQLQDTIKVQPMRCQVLWFFFRIRHLF